MYAFDPSETQNYGCDHEVDLDCYKPLTPEEQAAWDSLLNSPIDEEMEEF